MQRKIILTALVAVGLSVSGAWAQQELGHYANGEEGIKCASIPPGPGFFSRLYLDSYSAGTLRNGGGEAVDIGFRYDIQVAAFCNVWMTPINIMGADYGMYCVVPLVRQSIEIELAGLKEATRGLGDINLTPIMFSWHSPKADYLASLGTYFPTGDFEPTSALNDGYGFQTYIASLGTTYFPDAQKSWALAILARYEINGKKDGIDIAPGDRFEFDWAISKNVDRVWDIGLSGFCTWQVTDDRGADVDWNRGDHDRAMALGPEIVRFFWPAMLNVSLKHHQEFSVVDRTEGHATWLTLTQMF